MTLLALSFASVGLALHGPPADAGLEWCSEDPILSFSNGTHLQLLVKYEGVYASVVQNPIVWSIEVPINIGPVTVTAPTNASHREQITLRYTGGKWGGDKDDIQIHATTTVNAPGHKFPVELSVHGDTDTKPGNGNANKALTIASHTHHGRFTAYLGVITGTSHTFTDSGTVSLP